MNLSIQNPDALDSRIRKNEVLWKMTSKPIIRTSIVLMLLGAAMLYFDISSHYTIMKLATHKAIIYDLHLSFSIGLALLLLVFLMLFFLTLNKRANFRTLEKIINRHRLNSRGPMLELIEINDNGVSETTSEYRSEIKWIRFTHYKEHEGFLLLIMNGQVSSSIMIDKRFVEPSEYTQLQNFVKSKLVKMK
jgi:hypothetical protein